MIGEFLGYENSKGVIRGEDGKRYFIQESEVEYSQGDKLDFEVDGDNALSVFKLQKENNVMETVSSLKDKVKNIDTSKLSSNLHNAKSAAEESIKDINIESLKEIDYKSSFLGKFQNIFLVIMIISFFTPLVSLGGFISANGITATSQEVWPILLLIVPGLILFLNLTSKEKLSKPITIGYSALIILVVLYYEIFKGVEMLGQTITITSIIGFGGWMIILSSVMLLLIEFKILKENQLVKLMNKNDE